LAVAPAAAEAKEEPNRSGGLA